MKVKIVVKYYKHIIENTFKINMNDFTEYWLINSQLIF